jgi:phospholipase C
VCHDTFDHTSTHQLIERVFLSPGELTGQLHTSPWRTRSVGDLTAALPTLATPATAVPTLPPTSMGDPTVVEQNVLLGFAGTDDYGPAYPVPSGNGPVPAQDDPGPSRVTSGRSVPARP